MGSIRRRTSPPPLPPPPPQYQVFNFKKGFIQKRKTLREGKSVLASNGQTTKPPTKPNYIAKWPSFPGFPEAVGGTGSLKKLPT
ncbi:hypothetical protein LOK49_LG04G00638 [Camellia lanceoleosa]|uniref:Uncharacterized protein n=1 Tax=Camellia lanceoleosa TaxID=1840588 RepID=A0ACC0HWP4_9ERIC|nr:hypothetical protein LOK49_LG04G00638 [Camellia lanceoleosa]